MKHIATVLALSGLILSGCSVMHFKNGPDGSTASVSEAWHHNVAYSLFEVSPPVDLQKLCQGKGWTRVTTQETFITGLAGGADNALTGLFVPGGIDIWDPQLVQWSCADGAGSSGAAPAASEPVTPAPADTGAAQ